MIITIASFKGVVSKTTTAVHLAAYLQKRSPTLLIDGDPNRSATGWSRPGQLPFKVVEWPQRIQRTGRRLTPPMAQVGCLTTGGANFASHQLSRHFAQLGNLSRPKLPHESESQFIAEITSSAS
jgi:hypothetical protein